MANYFTPLAVSVAFALLLGILGMIEVGRRAGRRRAERHPEGAREGLGGTEGAVYGLFGLLLAFSFTGAASRFDERRVLIVDEANAIGTAYLRIDVLPPEVQPPLREAFRKYLDSRLAAYRKLPDVTAARAELARSLVFQNELWRLAVTAIRTTGTSPQALLPPINEMFDLAQTRTARSTAHPPAAIFGMLVALALVSAFLIGFGMAGSKDRSFLHEVAYAAVLATVIYLILDLEFPRLGFIRVDAADQVLVETRESMN